jgi:hypothetical protein
MNKKTIGVIRPQIIYERSDINDSEHGLKGAA